MENVTGAELQFAKEKLNNSNKAKDEHTSNLPSKIKQELAKCILETGTSNTLKKQSKKLYDFKRQTANS